MSEFEVVRSTTINAPRDRVRGLIEDFREWRRWSPWEGIDPNLQREYAGPESGAGARYAWQGNRRAGKGVMEITDSAPERVTMRLSFEKPFKATNQVFFEMEPSGDAATVVNWRMTGTHRGLMGLLAKVLNTDRRVGGDMEKGLARMKEQAEAGSSAPAAAS